MSKPETCLGIKFGFSTMTKHSNYIVNKNMTEIYFIRQLTFVMLLMFTVLCYYHVNITLFYSHAIFSSMSFVNGMIIIFTTLCFFAHM